MPTPTEQALDRLIEDFIRLHRETPAGLPLIDYDPEWPSPCYQADAQNGQPVPWQPVRQSEPTKLFEGLEAALETPIHPDIQAYYGRYWSDPLPARSADGDLSLLQIWNEADYERLRGNLIGHALSKHKIKQPLTFFFACTEPEDLVLSLENHSGRILLERPGRPPLREVASSLAEFLNSLTPLPSATV